MVKEYRVIKDVSVKTEHSEMAIIQKLNELGRQGYKVVSSCAFFVQGIGSKIYIIMEKETEP